MNIRTIEKYHAKQRRNRAITFSLIVHGILVIGIAIWLLKLPIEQEEDEFVIDFVPPSEQIHDRKNIVMPPDSSKTGGTASRLPAPIVPVIVPVPLTETEQKLEPLPTSTVVDLLPSPEAILKVISPTINKGSGGIDGKDTRQGSATGRKSVGRDGTGSDAGLGNLTQGGGAGQDPFENGSSDPIEGYKNELGDQLGSIIDEEDGIVRGHIRLMRLKHAMSDWWQDPTAIPSLIKWLREHTPTITADIDYEGGALPLTDKRIMEAPLLIMTGHDQAMSGSYERLAERNSQASGFSEVERASLRKYILDHNGMLFFDYCGNGGNEKSFAILVQTELRTVFPEYPMETLSIQHEIFQCHFKLERTPVGGSTFWGTSYKGGNNRWRYIKGISVPGRLGKPRLAVVFCPLDYLCSMETAEIDSRAPLSVRRSSDVYRFMTNMLIYQMRQRAANK